MGNSYFTMEGANEQLCNTSFSRKLPFSAFRAAFAWGWVFFYDCYRGGVFSLCAWEFTDVTVCVYICCQDMLASLIVFCLLKTFVLKLIVYSDLQRLVFLTSHCMAVKDWQMLLWLYNVRIKTWQVKCNKGVSKVLNTNKLIQTNIISCRKQRYVFAGQNEICVSLQSPHSPTEDVRFNDWRCSTTLTLLHLPWFSTSGMSVP